MRYILFGINAFFLLFSVVYVQAQFAPEKNVKVNVIFDSDMGPDYDDVGAITMLHAYADSGYANILATIASTKYEGVASVFSVFNTYFNRPDIPVGVPHNALNIRDSQGWSDSIRAKYPHNIKKNSQAIEAIELYRKVLASQPDASVTIITVGFLTNIANLLQTKPDKYSPLTGKELVKRKVRLMVSMAGGFPKGKEYNVYKDYVSSHYVFKHWKRPFLFSGWEIGADIKTGLRLINNNDIIKSPVKDVYRICIPLRSMDKDGRMSWDQTTVMSGIKGYHPFYGIVRGEIKIDKDGSNRWHYKRNGKHAYLVQYAQKEEITGYIENIMMHRTK